MGLSHSNVIFQSGNPDFPPFKTQITPEPAAFTLKCHPVDSGPRSGHLPSSSAAMRGGKHRGKHMHLSFPHSAPPVQKGSDNFPSVLSGRSSRSRFLRRRMRQAASNDLPDQDQRYTSLKARSNGGPQNSFSPAQS